MAEFTTSCPHCGMNLVAESSLRGKPVSCPGCGKTFVAAAAPPPRVPVPPTGRNGGGEVNAEEKSGYRWGRLYIMLARIFACIAVVVGLGVIVTDFYDIFALSRDLKRKLAQQTPELVARQQRFSENFDRKASLLMTGNHKAKFRFPSDITVMAKSFNEVLISPEDVGESLEAVEEYLQKLQKMTQVMDQYFRSSTGSIDSKLRVGDPVRVSVPRKKSRPNTSLSLNLRKDAEFYSLNRQELMQLIDSIAQAINALRRSNSGVSMTRELDELAAGLEFIRQTLCPAAEARRIGDRGAEETETTTSQAGTERFLREKALVRGILQGLSLLYSYDAVVRNSFMWQLTEELSQLKNALQQQESAAKEAKAKIRRAWELALRAAFSHLLMVLAAAFLIMVGADFMQAHFDSADALRKILRKGMMLLALMLLAGCGDPGAKELEAVKDKLAGAAIDTIFAEQIKENSHAVCYVKHGESMVMISGGLPAAPVLPPAEPPFMLRGRRVFRHVPIAFGRTYNVIRLDYRVESVKFTPIQSVKNKRYPRASMLTIQVKRNVAQGEAQLGVTVHWFLPEELTNADEAARKQWVDKKLAALPPDSFDHAVAIAGVSRDDGEPETLNCPVRFDSETSQWVLKKEEAVECGDIPLCDQSAIIAMLEKAGFRNATLTRDGRSETLNIAGSDYDTLQQLNAGLRKVESEWIEAEAVVQSERLERAVRDFAANRGNVSWEALQQFAELLEQLPKAEQREEAIARIAAVIEDKISDRANDKDQLAEFITKIENKRYAFLGPKQAELIELCRRHILRVEGKEQAVIEARRQKMRKFKDYIRNGDFAKVRAAATEEKLTDDPEFKDFLDTLLDLRRFLSPTQEDLEKLVKSNWWCRGYYLRRACRICLGTGKSPCNKCSNTGICSICSGRGERLHTEVVGGGGREGVPDIATSKVRCPKKCTFCEDQTRICRRCGGFSGTVDMKVLRAAIAAEQKLFYAWIDLIDEKSTADPEFLRKANEKQWKVWRAKCYWKLAHEGDPDAQYWLARYFEKIEDKAAARQWFLKAAERGNARGMIALGESLQAENKYDEALQWFRKAIAVGDDFRHDGLYNAALCRSKRLKNRAEREEMVKLFRRGAELGDDRAQHQLGLCCENGTAGVAKDYTNALKWYRMAAEQGNAAAQFEFGCCRALAIGKARDSEEAMEWIIKAAENGEKRALLFLETIEWLNSIDPLCQNPSPQAIKILSHLLLAAESGDPDALKILENHGWLFKAAEHGLPTAIRILEKLDKAAQKRDPVAVRIWGNLLKALEDGDDQALNIFENFVKAAEKGDTEAIRILKKLNMWPPKKEEKSEGETETTVPRRSRRSRR